MEREKTMKSKREDSKGLKGERTAGRTGRGKESVRDADGSERDIRNMCGHLGFPPRLLLLRQWALL